jgi:hypothetical protein
MSKKSIATFGQALVGKSKVLSTVAENKKDAVISTKKIPYQQPRSKLFF